MQRMQSRYFRAISAFYTWEALKELEAPNIVGADEARKNVAVMNDYSDFFNLSQESLRIYFFLELAKLYDEAEQSLHINKLINYAKGNIRKLSKKDFLKHHSGRQFIEELFNRYEELDNGELENLSKKINKHKKKIDKVKTYRDKFLAHDDKKKTRVTISRNEVIILFELIKESLSIFELKLDFSSTIYSHIESECKDEVKTLIQNLREYEQYRLKQSEDEYGTP